MAEEPKPPAAAGHAEPAKPKPAAVDAAGHPWVASIRAAAMACGLAVTLGLMNFINLAHGAFAMAGGYITVLLMNRAGVPFLACLPLAFAGTALLGAPVMALEAPVGSPSLRRICWRGKPDKTSSSMADWASPRLSNTAMSVRCMMLTSTVSKSYGALNHGAPCYTEPVAGARITPPHR